MTYSDMVRGNTFDHPWSRELPITCEFFLVTYGSVFEESRHGYANNWSCVYHIS